jgi:histidinol-phosphatase (PHP family)
VIIDYHLHLRTRDPTAEIENIDHTVDAVERYVEAASAAGVDEIGLTEHVYYFRQTEELWDVPYQRERCRFDLDAYADAVLEGKRRGLPVKLGLEVDYVGARQARLTELLAPYPWDFLLGSVHWIDGLAIDQRPGMWDGRTTEQVWSAYFAALAELARSGAVDVLAHPDLVKIFGDRAEDADAHWSRAASAIREAGVAVEISTAGLRRPVGELYPAPEFLGACRERRVPITVASDAHAPPLVGQNFEAAIELARATGYDTVSVFEGRERRQEPLG